jgi:hypothetical protein
VVGEGAEVGEAAGAVQLALVVELLREGDDVEGLGALGERGDRLEDQLVLAAVEVALADPVRDLVPGAVFQHQAAEYGLLGLYGVGRHAQPVRGGNRGGFAGKGGLGHGGSAGLARP